MSPIRKQWLTLLWAGLALMGIGLALFRNISWGQAQLDETAMVMFPPTPPPTVPATSPEPAQILSGIIPGLPPDTMLVAN